MAIEAIKGAGMVYQGSTSTAQIKEQAQGRTEVSSADNQVVSDSIARNIQAMNTKEASAGSGVVNHFGHHGIIVTKIKLVRWRKQRKSWNVL